MPAVRGSRLLSMLTVPLVETLPTLFIQGNSWFENDDACLFLCNMMWKLWKKHLSTVSKKCHFLVNNFLEFYYWLLKVTNQIITAIELYTNSFLSTCKWWAVGFDMYTFHRFNMPDFWISFFNGGYIFLVTKWTNKF